MSSIPLDTLALRGSEASPSSAPPPASTHLASMPVGACARVLQLSLDTDLAAWLRAVGVAEGERLTVLRRAAFGGPVHVRTASGGEFALNRALARAIVTRVE